MKNLNSNSTLPCPKCQYQRRPKDQDVHPGVCPACGIAYAKWHGTTKPESGKHKYSTFEESNTQHQTETFIRKCIIFFTAVPEQTDKTVFWGQVILFGLFVLWGISFIIHGVDWEYIGGSFLHSVNLPFHEFGHVLFSPFGRFMAILGGSLFQVLMPLIAMLSFSWQKRDNFAAAIMLWWAGQNLIDVSPYIADAKYRALPLILGLGEESHDWGNLLTMLNMVDSATGIANFVFIIGSITIIFSLYWAAYILLKQKKNLADFIP